MRTWFAESLGKLFGGSFVHVPEDASAIVLYADGRVDVALPQGDPEQVVPEDSSVWKASVLLALLANDDAYAALSEQVARDLEELGAER